MRGKSVWARLFCLASRDQREHRPIDVEALDWLTDLHDPSSNCSLLHSSDDDALLGAVGAIVSLKTRYIRYFSSWLTRSPRLDPFPRFLQHGVELRDARKRFDQYG